MVDFIFSRIDILGHLLTGHVTCGKAYNPSKTVAYGNNYAVTVTIESPNLRPPFFSLFLVVR